MGHRAWAETTPFMQRDSAGSGQRPSHAARGSANGAALARAPGVAFSAVRWTEDMIVAALRDWVDRYEQVPLRVDWDRGMAKRRGHADKLERLQTHPSRVPSPTAVLARFGSWQAALTRVPQLVGISG